MNERLMSVLQDTRNASNPNICALCKGIIQPVMSDYGENYEVYMFRCSQCGAVFSVIAEYLESDSSDS